MSDLASEAKALGRGGVTQVTLATSPRAMKIDCQPALYFYPYYSGKIQKNLICAGFSFFCGVSVDKL